MPEFLPVSIQLLDHEKKAVRREMCWTLSNITAGNSNQIERIITFPNLIEKLLKIATTDTLEVQGLNYTHLSKKVKREAIWVLSNAVKDGTQLQKDFLHKKGALKCFISSLELTDTNTLRVALEGILNFIKGEEISGQEDENPFKKYFKENCEVSIINELQENNDENISELADDIINML